MPGRGICAPQTADTQVVALRQVMLLICIDLQFLTSVCFHLNFLLTWVP